MKKLVLGLVLIFSLVLIESSANAEGSFGDLVTHANFRVTVPQVIAIGKTIQYMENPLGGNQLFFLQPSIGLGGGKVGVGWGIFSSGEFNTSGFLLKASLLRTWGYIPDQWTVEPGQVYWGVDTTILRWLYFGLDIGYFRNFESKQKEDLITFGFGLGFL